MIRRALLAAVVFAFMAGTFSAQAFSSDIELWVDADWTAYLHNTTGADISFDGYQIVSESNRLDVAGWDSISDRFPGRLTELLDNLGAGAVAFGELNPNSGQIAEGNLTGVGVLKAGAKFSLGKPFNPPVGMGLRFFFKLGGSITATEGCIGSCIPEPSTFLLATLAGLGLAGMRCRAARSATNASQV